MNRLLFVVMVIYLCIQAANALECDFMVLAPLNGELNSCECGGKKKGGLARVRAIADKYHSAGRLLLSGCNNLDPAGDVRKNRLILGQMSKMNFAGVGIGWADLKGGVDNLLSLAKNGSIPWVNCNLLLSGKPLTAGFIAVRKKGMVYGLTGAVSQVRVNSPLLTGMVPNITVLPAPESLLNQVKRHLSDADVFIVLSDMTPEEEDRLTEIFPPDVPLLIIGSSGRPGLESERRSGPIAVLNPGGQGRQGWEVNWKGKGSNFTCTKIPIDSGVALNRETEAEVDVYWRTYRPPLQKLPETAGNIDRKADMLINDKNEKSLTFFYSPNCDDCREIIENSLDRGVKENIIVVKYSDMNDPAEYELLKSLQAKTGVPTREIPVAFYGGRLYDGKGKVEKLLAEILSKGRSKNNQELKKENIYK